MNCHKPPLVMNAVLGLASGAKGTCQYPLHRSREENQEDPTTVSKASLMHGRRYGSFLVTLLRGLKSTQTHQSSFVFLGTMTTGEAQELVEGSMSPAHCMSGKALSAAVWPGQAAS